VSARSAAKVAAVLMASAVAIPGLVKFEGWVNRTYKDPVSIATDCVGNTKGAVMGVIRTDAECEQRLIEAAIEHGMKIAPCLPETLPTETRAAFISFAYNVGAAKACGSTMFRKAKAGDLEGACAELSKWVYAGSRRMQGLVNRRVHERALCEQGLA